MPETKKTESLKAAAKAPVAAPAAKEEVKTAAAEVKAEAKKPAVKKASAPAAKKPAVKKAAVKTEEKKPVKKEAKAEKKPAAKKETKAASTEVKTNIVLQYADKNVTFDTLVENAQNVCLYDMGKKASDIKKLDLYVKPEENTVYFVLNDKEHSQYGL